MHGSGWLGLSAGDAGKLRDLRLASLLNIGNSSGKVRRRRLNVPALYELEGQHRYGRRFNPAGLIA